MFTRTHHHPRRALGALAGSLLGLLLAAGCAGTGATRTYVDKNMDFGALKAVAVLPLVNLTRDTQGADRARDVFATQLLATNAVYVVPQGEVARALAKAAVANPAAPTVEEVQKLGTLLKVDAVVTGTLKEYGEVRSGTAAANAISLSLQLQECGTGKVVWSGASTRGGIGFKDRLFGGGGEPLNAITEAAVNDLLDQLFK